MFPNANPLVSDLYDLFDTSFDALVVGKAIDLMEKCLAFSPKRRLDVSEALQHPYLQVGLDG